METFGPLFEGLPSNHTSGIRKQLAAADWVGHFYHCVQTIAGFDTSPQYSSGVKQRAHSSQLVLLLATCLAALSPGSLRPQASQRARDVRAFFGLTTESFDIFHNTSLVVSGYAERRLHPHTMSVKRAQYVLQTT